MSDKYYAVVVGRDHLICKILDDETVLNVTKLDSGEEYISDINKDFIVIKNVYSLVVGPQQMMLIPFSSASYGSTYVTIARNQISEIYFLKEELQNNVQAQESGITTNV